MFMHSADCARKVLENTLLAEDTYGRVGWTVRAFYASWHVLPVAPGDTMDECDF